MSRAVSIILAILLFLTSSCTIAPTTTTPATPTTKIRSTAIARITPTPTIAKAMDRSQREIIPLQISRDPYQNSEGQYSTEVEPGAFSYGSTIVATFQAGRFRDIGATNIGWATSRDGGITWKNGFLAGTTKVAGGPYDRITDPVVTYDGAHKVWMIATVARLATAGGLTAPAVLVNLSTDGGITWGKPIPIMDAGSGGILDKDWVACDNTSTSPFYGHCYAEWDDFRQNDLVEMSTSTDGGRTWGTAKTTANSVSGIGGLPLIQPGGKVIVPVSRGNESGIMAFTSSNGGISWSSTISITSVTSYAKNAYFSGYIFLTSGIDASGKVYLVWVDCRFEQNCYGNDLAMTSSTDGITWQPVQRIPLAPVASGINYYVPGLGIDPTTSGGLTHLAITYYYYAASCLSNCPLYTGFVSSTNGGASWSSKTQLAGPMPGNWLPAGNNKVGDYITTCFSGGKAFPVFPIALAPSGGHLNEGMYTVAGGLRV